MIGIDETATEWWMVIALAIAASLWMTYELANALVVRASSGRPFLTVLPQEMRRRAGVALPLALLAFGVSLGTSFISAIGDDYARYWMIAEALAGGWPYPASPVSVPYQIGGMSPYLVDLPGLPAAMLLSFAVFGHDAFGAMIPVIASASLFPLLMYLALRELTRNVALSYVAAAGLSLFPLLLFYVLRSAEPDGMFLSLLAALAFLALRSDADPDSRWTWLALGLVAGLTALTRPEGIMYATLALAAMALRHRTHRGYWLAAALYVAPLALFSLVMLRTFGQPWPSTFAGTVHLEHIAGNLAGFTATALPGYAEALGVPEAFVLFGGAVFALLYAAGSLLLWRRRPQAVFLALLPVLSILVFLLVNPVLTRPHLPYDFFRRASYGLPYMTIVATYAVALLLAQLPRFKAGQVMSILVLLSSIVVVSYETKLGLFPEAEYAWGTQILLHGNTLLAADLHAHPYQLPNMPFEWDGSVWTTAESFDYIAFRDDMNAHYAPHDLHGSDRRIGNVLASFGFFVLGLGYAVVSWRKAAARSGGE
jgi:hypothetical protein